MILKVAQAGRLRYIVRQASRLRYDFLQAGSLRYARNFLINDQRDKEAKLADLVGDGLEFGAGICGSAKDHAPSSKKFTRRTGDM